MLSLIKGLAGAEPGSARTGISGKGIRYTWHFARNELAVEAGEHIWS